MYKVKYELRDSKNGILTEHCTYTNEDFESYSKAANWLREESDTFQEACDIDTKNARIQDEVADDLVVVRIAPRGENDPIEEIPLKLTDLLIDAIENDDINQVWWVIGELEKAGV